MTDPLLGTLVMGYRIDALLAQGGMGAVYLARDVTLPDIRKVIKTILPELANNASIRERFLREAQAVAKLHHPKIVGIDGLGTLADGRPCMVIPFLEGKPLDRVLFDNGGRLPPHRVMRVTTHIADALDHVHQRGIIHRDLKPGNVFVEPTASDAFFCKVLDFGIAKQLDARAKRLSPTLATPTGTACYMAVEQYICPSDVTPAADVFALAVMVWQMVVGALPWGEHDPVLMYQLQLQQSPAGPLGDSLSPEWEAILRAALSPDPRLRPQTMRQLVQVLASALPAIGPLVPSGVEIVAKIAEHLLKNTAHDDETVRNQSGRPIILSSGVLEAPAPPSSLLPPTLNERPGTPPAAPAPAVSSPLPGSKPTTLGSSTGTIEAVARPGRRTRALLGGLVAAGSVGVATFALLATRGGGPNPAAEPVHQPAELPSAATSTGATSSSDAPAPLPPPSTAPPPSTTAPDAAVVQNSPAVPAPTRVTTTKDASASIPAEPAATPPAASSTQRPLSTTAAAPPKSRPMLSTPAPPKPAVVSKPRTPPAVPTVPSHAPSTPPPVEPPRAAPEPHHLSRDSIGGRKEN